MTKATKDTKDYCANRGCGGGLPSLAFDYAHDNAIHTEDTYPYKAESSACKAN